MALLIHLEIPNWLLWTCGAVVLLLPVAFTALAIHIAFNWR